MVGWMCCGESFDGWDSAGLPEGVSLEQIMAPNTDETAIRDEKGHIVAVSSWVFP